MSRTSALREDISTLKNSESCARSFFSVVVCKSTAARISYSLSSTASSVASGGGSSTATVTAAGASLSSSSSFGVELRTAAAAGVVVSSATRLVSGFGRNPSGSGTRGSSRRNPRLMHPCCIKNR